MAIRRVPLAAEAVEGAGGVCVSVVIHEDRDENRDRVSSRRNGFGIETAAIRSLRPVPALEEDALETELRALGLRLGEGGARLEVQVVTFSADIKPGFFSGDVVAEFTLAASAHDADGRPLHAGVDRGLDQRGG